MNSSPRVDTPKLVTRLKWHWKTTCPFNMEHCCWFQSFPIWRTNNMKTWKMPISRYWVIFHFHRKSFVELVFPHMSGNRKAQRRSFVLCTGLLCLTHFSWQYQNYVRKFTLSIKIHRQTIVHSNYQCQAYEDVKKPWSNMNKVPKVCWVPIFENWSWKQILKT